MKRKGYCWVVCIGCAMILFCNGGLAINAFSVYMPYILNVNHFTNAQSSSIVTFRTFSIFLSMFLTGVFYRKLNVRRGMALAGIATVGGFLLFSCASSYALYCIGAILVGAGYGMGGMIPVSILLMRWFDGRGVLAFGLCSASTGLANLGFPSLITMLIEKSGLQAAFMTVTLSMTALILAGILMIRDDPSEGGETASADRKKPNPAERGDEVSPLNRRNWIVMSIALLCVGAAMIVGNSHMSVLMSSQNYDAQVIALMISLFGLMLMLGKCVFGMISQRMTIYGCNWMFGSAMSVGLILMTIARSSVALMAVGVALYSFGLAFPMVGITAWAKDMSSAREYSRTVRWFQILNTGGSVAFSTVPGIIADGCGGSYIPAFVIACAMSVGVLLAVQWTYRHLATRA